MDKKLKDCTIQEMRDFCKEQQKNGCVNCPLYDEDEEDVCDRVSWKYTKKELNRIVKIKEEK